MILIVGTYELIVLQKKTYPIDISTSKNDIPVQPILNIFPSTNGRRFSAIWYKFNWIEYSIIEDSIYCFPCRHFSASMLTPGNILGKVPFVDYGLKCWKEPKKTINSHCKNNKHLFSMTQWVNYRNIQNNLQSSIAFSLDKASKKDISENRLHVHYLLKCALYLAKQGLAFRGHDEAASSNNRGNYIELLETYADENLLVRIRSRYGHYTSPNYQNDLIHILAECTVERILNKMSSFGTFAILVDETKDASKKEQLSFVLRFIDNDFNIFEHALGCYHMKESTAKSLSEEIIKILSKYRLDINKCVAQCYDGASVMSGCFAGVQKRIQSIVPQAIYIHCYAHRLNLCLVQTLKSISPIYDFFQTVQGIYKFLMNSQIRNELFVEVQKQKNLEVIHLERLVETRWAYWYKSLKKVNNRFIEICEVLSVLSSDGDENCRIMAVGYLKEISCPRFISILISIESVLEIVYCTSNELQNSKLLLSSAIKLVNLTKTNLSNLRSNKIWEKLHNKIKIKAKAIGLEINTEKKEKRKQILNKNLQDYFISTTIGKNISKQANVQCFKTDIFFAAIDRYVQMQMYIKIRFIYI